MSHTPRSTYRENYTARSVSGASVATSRLSTSRRAKLEKMRREASGDRERKRYKLQAVLKDKLVAKYGNLWRAMIEGEVDAFITKTMSRRIHENDLAGLENTIRRKTQSSQPNTGRGGSATGRRSQRSPRGSARPETTRSQRSARRKVGAGQSGPAGQTTIDDWTLLDAFDALNNEIAVKQKRRKQRAEQLALKRELDEQVALRESIASKKRSEDVKYYSGIVDEVKQFHLEEKAKAAARHKVVMKMAQERQQQIQLERARKEREKSARMKYEIDLLESAAKEIARDARKVRKAKRLQIKHAAIVKEENERLLEERKKQDLLDAEHDRELQRQFVAREKKKEADRRAFFEATAKKQAQRAAHNEESRCDEFAKVREMELRLLREQAERDKKAGEKEKAEQAKRRKDLQERNRILKQQVDAKRKARHDQRKKDALFIETFKADADAFAAEERRKKIAARQKKIIYRSMLNEQQAQGREGVQMMTDHERQLNKEKLMQIKSNPALLNQLHDRVMKGSPKKKKPSGDIEEDEDDDE